MHPLALADNIRILTAHITARRFTLENERMHMSRLIEIKGLGADIAAVKKGIGELRAAATELNTEKAGLTAEIKDLTEQLKQHRADLRFEAETLGNSSPEPVQEPKTPPPPPLPPATPPDVVHAFEIALQQPEPQITPQDPARAMVR